jgi:hypothetical protein
MSLRIPRLAAAAPRALVADVHLQQEFLLRHYRFVRSLPTSAAVIEEGRAPKRAMT